MDAQIDYDENIWDIQKLVEQKYKIIEEHERAAQRKKEEVGQRNLFLNMSPSLRYVPSFLLRMYAV